MLLFSPFEGFSRAFRSDQVGGDVADRLGCLGGSLSESALSTYHHRMGVAFGRSVENTVGTKNEEV